MYFFVLLFFIVLLILLHLIISKIINTTFRRMSENNITCWEKRKRSSDVSTQTTYLYVLPVVFSARRGCCIIDLLNHNVIEIQFIFFRRNIVWSQVSRVVFRERNVLYKYQEIKKNNKQNEEDIIIFWSYGIHLFCIIACSGSTSSQLFFYTEFFVFNSILNNTRVCVSCREYYAMKFC